MMQEIAITSLGIISSLGISRDSFWQAQNQNKDGITEINTFPADEFHVRRAGEVRDFNPGEAIGPRGLRNLDRSTLFLLASSRQALTGANVNINGTTTGRIGICTGTTFSHLESILEFDREVTRDGLNQANPALFPSNVMNAPSSHVAIRFNVQGFNATVSSGYTSGLDVLNYASHALENGQTDIVLAGAVEALTYPVFFGFHNLGYMAGLKGLPVSCPFDRRRNGPILGEASVSLCLETGENARKRGASIMAKIKGLSGFFDPAPFNKIWKQRRGLSEAIRTALGDAGVDTENIDYISSCANSSYDFDRTEVAALRDVFGSRLKNIPASSVKSMLGETVSASAMLQVASCLGAMQYNIIPATINYAEKDPECDIDCVPNKSQKKDVRLALVVSLGPGGYNGACVLEKFTNN